MNCRVERHKNQAGQLLGCVRACVRACVCVVCVFILLPSSFAQSGRAGAGDGINFGAVTERGGVGDSADIFAGVGRRGAFFAAVGGRGAVSPPRASSAAAEEKQGAHLRHAPHLARAQIVLTRRKKGTNTYGHNHVALYCSGVLVVSPEGEVPTRVRRTVLSRRTSQTD